MKYNFRSIEKKWQKYWANNNTYQTNIDLNKKKAVRIPIELLDIIKSNFK